MRITGYAAVYGQKVKIGDHFEVIDKGAFDGADLSDVILTVNHDGIARARTIHGNLKLTPDKNGLKFMATLSMNKDSSEVADKITNGALDGMSFRAKVIEAKGAKRKGVLTVRIKRIGRVHDVSVVNNPVYPGAKIEVTENV